LFPSILILGFSFLQLPPIIREMMFEFVLQTQQQINRWNNSGRWQKRDRSI